MTGAPISSTDRSDPMTWSRDEWRKQVSGVRAGNRLPERLWPGNARVAVAISFDVDHETPWLSGGDVAPAGLAFGEFGSRRGLPRILNLLEKYRVKGSFFIPAVAADLHPGDVADIVAAGHEVGYHGWIHERADRLEPGVERELLLRSLDMLERLGRVRPVGGRAPSFGISSNTLRLMSDAGLSYDSSLMADEMPYEILLDGLPSGLTEVPVDWARDDAAFLVTDRYGGLRQVPDPQVMIDSWLDDFHAAVDDGGMFQLTLHPDLIGRRAPFRAFTRLVETITTQPGVWFATHAEIAALVPNGRSLK